VATSAARSLGEVGARVGADERLGAGNRSSRRFAAQRHDSFPPWTPGIGAADETWLFAGLVEVQQRPPATSVTATITSSGIAFANAQLVGWRQLDGGGTAALAGTIEVSCAAATRPNARGIARASAADVHHGS
jgi:hypothetical protein